MFYSPFDFIQVEFKSPEAVPSLGPGLGLDSQSPLMSLPMLSKPELIKTGTSDTQRINNTIFLSVFLLPSNM